MENDKMKKDYLQDGELIRNRHFLLHDLLTNEPIEWISLVYRKPSSYVKISSPWIIDNETRFLNAVGKDIHFPKVIDSGEEGEKHWIEITAIQGQNIFQDLWGLRIGYIRRFAMQLLNRIEYLYDINIMHRDITCDDNVLVDYNNEISIIDFAWAIDFRNDKQFFYTKPSLNQNSDFYSMALIFEERYGKMPFVHAFTSELKQIDWVHYSNTEYVKKHITKAREELAKSFNIKDVWEFMNAKYKLYKYLLHPIKAFKRLTK